MADTGPAAVDAREGGGAGRSQVADGSGAPAPENAPPSPVKSDLTYADPPPKPPHPTPAKVNGGSARTPTAAMKEPQEGDVTLSALVAADRSASTSSSFSRDYVERWRSTVELSEDELSFGTDELLDDDKPKAAAALTSQSGGYAADPGSTSTLKRAQSGLELEGAGTSSRHGTLSAAGRLATRAGRAPQLADQNKPPKAASLQRSKRADKFGRDLTNEKSTETSNSSDSSASESTPRKAPVRQRTRATAKGGKGKKPLRKTDLADETLAETEKHRKEKAREKWKEIDEFQLETVYTL